MKNDLKEKNNKKKYVVYLHTFPNNKHYVGITCVKPVERRWRGGSSYKNQRKIYNAILKYGWKNIKHEILFFDLTLEEANKGKKLKEENKNHLKKYIMEHGAWNKGKKLSKEHLEKITAERKSRCNKKIYALDKDTMQIVKEFSSCTEASIYVGVSKSNISRCCKGKRPTSGGYKWRYANEN